MPGWVWSGPAHTMNVLYLAHCVPNPPDKGDRIRAHYELRQLARHHTIHLVCFARSAAEAACARQLEQYCASVYVEILPPWRSLIRAAVRFGLGGCLNVSYFHSPRMERHVAALAQKHHLNVALAYTAVMAPYVPAGLPMVMDLVDVDSEKWLEYGKLRKPGFLYRLEAKRLRAEELKLASRADMVFLTTEPETKVFRTFAPEVPVQVMENGVDFEYFDAEKVTPMPELKGRRYLVFVAAFDYFPNWDGACWFAAHIFPELRREDPGLELLLVGRNPSPRVVELGRSAGITVTGTVADIRPYVAGSAAAVVPLRIARGIQNKILESLALDRHALISPAAALTFGTVLPAGVEVCDTAGEYRAALARVQSGESPRNAARNRYSWEKNLESLLIAAEAAGRRSTVIP